MPALVRPALREVRSRLFDSARWAGYRPRGDDIIMLADHFLRRFAAETGQQKKRLSAAATAKLRAYHWPGNVRELRNLAERLAILVPGDTVERSTRSCPR